LSLIGASRSSTPVLLSLILLQGIVEQSRSMANNAARRMNAARGAKAAARLRSGRGFSTEALCVLWRKLAALC